MIRKRPARDSLSDGTVRNLDEPALAGAIQHNDAEGLHPAYQEVEGVAPDDCVATRQQRRIISGKLTDRGG